MVDPTRRKSLPCMVASSACARVAVSARAVSELVVSRDVFISSSRIDEEVGAPGRLQARSDRLAVRLAYFCNRVRCDRLAGQIGPADRFEHRTPRAKASGR